MKPYLALLLCTMSLAVCYSQDTIYLDKDWNPTTPKDKDAAYYRTSVKKGEHLFDETVYYIDGKKEMTGNYRDTGNSRHVNDGYFKYYGEDGSIIKEGVYKNNIRYGDWKYYYKDDDGNTQFYENGNDTQNNVRFENTASFVNSRFADTIYFSHSVFKKDALFNASIFDENAYFNSVRFHGDVSFRHTELNYIDFDSSVFYGSVDMSHAHFHDLMVLSFDTFTKKLDLSYCDSADVLFLKTTLPDTIDFSYNSKIPEEIDLSQCNFKNPGWYDPEADPKHIGRYHYINLYKSDISAFHLDYHHFRLYFPDHLSGDEINSIYEALLGNFKANGQAESYQLLDIEYHNYLHHLLHSKSIPNIWYAYGYKKERIFFWTFFFLLLFTLITFTSLPYFQKYVYTVDAVANLVKGEGKDPEQIEDLRQSLAFRNFHKRLWCSFIYTSFIFMPIAMKFDKLKADKILAAFYLLMVYTTGLVCIGYIAIFVMQK